MREDLDTQADSYAVFISRDLDPDFITVGMVRQFVAEAYKQGYIDALSPVKEDGMYLMSDEDCQRITDMLNYTRDICRNATENIKDLTRLVPKEEFRNRLKHKDE